MRIGLIAVARNPVGTPEFLRVLATSAESLGFASLWLGEHVVYPEHIESRYPYGGTGKSEEWLEDGTGMLEQFATLAYLANATSRLRLGTGVCLVPQRNPLYTAKSVATLDWLTNGRFDFGVGIGWLREEYEALGVPWESRGARCREYVELMRLLWTQDLAHYEGKYVSLTPSRMYPKPVQRPHPPIYFGGESEAALKRVAELGNGLHAYNVSPGQVSELLERLELALKRAGRSIDDIDVTVAVGKVNPTSEDVRRYADAGVDQLICTTPLVDPDRLPGMLEQIMDRCVG